MAVFGKRYPTTRRNHSENKCAAKEQSECDNWKLASMEALREQSKKDIEVSMAAIFSSHSKTHLNYHPRTK
jgi:hypothetical protein